MSTESRLRYEAAGVVVLIAAGAVTLFLDGLLSPLVPWISAAWLFVVLVLAALYFG